MGINEYWIASANSPIQVSFQLPEGNIESAGFLLEFGGKKIHLIFVFITSLYIFHEKNWYHILYITSVLLAFMH